MRGGEAFVLISTHSSSDTFYLTSNFVHRPPDPRVSAQLLDSEPPADMMGKAPHLEKPKIRGKLVFGIQILIYYKY